MRRRSRRAGGARPPAACLTAPSSLLPPLFSWCEPSSWEPLASPSPRSREESVLRTLRRLSAGFSYAVPRSVRAGGAAPSSSSGARCCRRRVLRCVCGGGRGASRRAGWSVDRSLFSSSLRGRSDTAQGATGGRGRVSNGFGNESPSAWRRCSPLQTFESLDERGTHALPTSPGSSRAG